MIRRNVASQPILIGPLTLIADGSLQTSGAAIAVRKDGTDVGAAGGTLSHVTSGVWQYIPTQGETDCGIVGLILTKADCWPVPQNVLTTLIPVQTAAGANGGLPTVDGNNRVAGIQGTITTLDALDTAQDTQHSTTQSAIGTVDTVVDAIKVDTAAILLDTGTDGVVVAAGSKTGYSLTQSFPTNFASLGINASGHISRVTLVDENTDMRGTDGAITSLSGVSTHSAADVWAVTTRLLSAGTNIVLAKGTGVTGFNDVSTAQVNAEVDTALTEYGGPTNAQMEARTLLAASYGTSANQTTILNRLGAWTGTGVNTILGAFKALLSNTASNPSDIGGTFDPATDSTEAIRNRGDAAWTTADVSSIPTAIQNADAYLARGVSNVEDTADRHSVAAMVMIQTNASVNEAGTTLTAKKPSDDSTFATYTLTASAGADPVTGIS